ncbi:GL12856 [Drosophila persimilis]|uniref:GL12856 n=1 Tax=Drosophila persimilis TaxID=7234 RepID=B4IRR2_DROPE|nr:GL12856 [Drosophila persimilis]
MDTFSSTAKLNETHLNFTLEFTEVYKKENGTYKCVVYDSAGTEGTSKEINLFVMEVPQVSIEFAKAVGASKIFLNWTVNDGNDPVQKYFISFSQQGTPTYTYYKDIINGNNTSYILESFLPNTTYSLRILGKNSIGDGAPTPVSRGHNNPIFRSHIHSQGGNDWEHSVDDNHWLESPAPGHNRVHTVLRADCLRVGRGAQTDRGDDSPAKLQKPAIHVRQSKDGHRVRVQSAGLQRSNEDLWSLVGCREWHHHGRCVDKAHKSDHQLPPSQQFQTQLHFDKLELSEGAKREDHFVFDHPGGQLQVHAREQYIQREMGTKDPTSG